MSKQEIVTIPSYASTPFGDRPCSNSQEINSWLDGTDPTYVRGAGQTYANASSKVEQAVNALEEHAGRIVQIWKGPDSALARDALLLLHATGQELSTKMRQMGTALQTYAGHLETARTEAKRAPTGAEVAGNHLQATDAEDSVILQAAKNTIAQDAIHKLNTEIVTIFNSEVPPYIMYELPTVNLPGAGSYDNPGYPIGTTSRGPTFGSLATDPSGVGPGATVGTTPVGTTPDGTNPGGVDGTDPNNPNNPNDPNDPNNPDGPNGPGTQEPDPPPDQNPAQNSATNPGDGTAPPVIGAENRTTTDGTDGVNPYQTDLATFTPTTAVTPTTFTPVTNTVTPYSVVGTSPGVPSVIGSPGALGGQSPMGAVGRGFGGGGLGGTPFMPYMGGGAGGAGEHSDIERTTYLSEDPNAWTTGHDTTDPVIG
ncbi:WXG100 family type VII secretion target [Nonomuraea sp. NPDC048826]|uniref:WXG100 family type VII secretion target n=1 Tax=Nonomuraea sp. NPDC048826 TaxID=3364347 RepID=UPI003719DEF5